MSLLPGDYSLCSAWIARSKPPAMKNGSLQARSSQVRQVLPAEPLDLTIQRERVSSNAERKRTPATWRGFLR